MKNNIETRLQKGVTELGMEMTDLQLSLLLEYVELLVKWNKVYNLTAIRDPLQILVRHLLDSLAVAPWCTAQRYIDVGTGAGLPGIPLAIVYPDKEIHLLDSNGKKTRFLFQVKTALGLDNISVHNARVELFKPAERYDVVLSRAYASLLDMVTGCRHLLCEKGKYLAMKGTLNNTELTSVEALGLIPNVQELNVPQLDEQRHLVILSGN